MGLSLCPVFGFISTSISHNNNQVWRGGRSTSTDLTFQVMMTLLLVGHMINVYGFIATSINPIITQLGNMEDQHALILPGRYDDVITTRSSNKH